MTKENIVSHEPGSSSSFVSAPLAMASRSDSGNDTRGSSESDNSPTPSPTKNLHRLRPFPHHKLQPLKILPKAPVSTTGPTKALGKPSSIGSQPPVETPNSKYVTNSYPSQTKQNFAQSTGQAIDTKTTPIFRTTPSHTPQSYKATSQYPLINIKTSHSNVMSSRNSLLMTNKLPSRSSLETSSQKYSISAKNSSYISKHSANHHQPPRLAPTNHEQPPRIASANHEHPPRIASANHEHPPRIASANHEHPPRIASANHEHTPRIVVANHEQPRLAPTDYDKQTRSSAANHDSVSVPSNQTEDFNSSLPPISSNNSSRTTPTNYQTRTSYKSNPTESSSSQFSHRIMVEQGRISSASTDGGGPHSLNYHNEYKTEYPNSSMSNLNGPVKFTSSYKTQPMKPMVTRLHSNGDEYSSGSFQSFGCMDSNHLSSYASQAGGAISLGSLGDLNQIAAAGGSTSGSSSLSSARGRQRNSVAVVDSRDHIYEELDFARGPPRLTPISGVLPQGKLIHRPVAFKPPTLSGSHAPNMMSPSGPIAVVGGRNANCGPLANNPALNRLGVPHYGSLGDLKSLGYYGDRKNGVFGVPLNKKFESPPDGGVPNRPLHASLTHLHVTENGSSSSAAPVLFAKNLPKREVMVTHKNNNTSDGTTDASFDSESLHSTSGEEAPSSAVPPSPHHHFLRHHYFRIGGSVSNLTKIGQPQCSTTDRSASAMATTKIKDTSPPSDHLPQHTPSPSEAGVGEFEAIIKEKDSEINQLKETMEQSEQILFKVYEQKEKSWERELKKIREFYECKLKAAHQKANEFEQNLGSRNQQLHSERRKLQLELSDAKRSCDKSQSEQGSLQGWVSSLKSQLEETEWRLCQKSGEISLLKAQLKDCQGDQTSRGHELLHLRAQLRQYTHEVERRQGEMGSMQELIVSLRREVNELRGERQTGEEGHAFDQLRKAMHELNALREERVQEREKVAEERARWQEEKERVLQYQKQLQMACAHAQRSNAKLQAEINSLKKSPKMSPSSLPPLPAIPPPPLSYSPPLPPGVLSQEALC